MDIAIYAGTFDPPTNGHLEIIKKSLPFCSQLHVIIASSSKVTEFTKEERKQMILDILWAEAALEEDPAKKTFLKNIIVEILPESILLANYAKTIGAKILIRGMRDTLDFLYEQKIEKTNREINPDLQSVFIMPSLETQNISSSWVKEINKYKDSYNILINAVNPMVLSKLDEKKVKTNFQFACESSHRLFQNWNSETKFRYYHNYSHIINMFEDYGNANFSNINNKHCHLLESIYIHDSHSFNQEPKDLDLNYKSLYIKTFVLATDYKSNQTFEEMIPEELSTSVYVKHGVKNGIAAIRYLDLKILGSSPKEYDKYVELIKKEYYLNYCKECMSPIPFSLWIRNLFNPKRLEMMKNFLNKIIFLSPDEEFTKKYNINELEANARRNIEKEIREMERN